jgi:hypothetical protein
MALWCCVGTGNKLGSYEQNWIYSRGASRIWKPLSVTPNLEYSSYFLFFLISYNNLKYKLIFRNSREVVLFCRGTECSLLFLAVFIGNFYSKHFLLLPQPFIIYCDMYGNRDHFWPPNVACYAIEDAVQNGKWVLFTTSLVVTTRNYYTVTHLHRLQSLQANISFYLFGASGIHLENFENCRPLTALLYNLGTDHIEIAVSYIVAKECLLRRC